MPLRLRDGTPRHGGPQVQGAPESWFTGVPSTEDSEPILLFANGRVDWTAWTVAGAAAHGDPEPTPWAWTPLGKIPLKGEDLVETDLGALDRAVVAVSYEAYVIPAPFLDLTWTFELG